MRTIATELNAIKELFRSRKNNDRYHTKKEKEHITIVICSLKKQNKKTLHARQSSWFIVILNHTPTQEEILVT